MNINIYKSLKRVFENNSPSFIEAHLEMEPDTKQGRRNIEYLETNKNTKKSSVLILFYEKDETIMVPFIKRQNYKGVHSGQISFPGGKIEPEDKNLQETALREAKEEIGLNINNVEIIGNLTDIYIYPSDNLVTPYIGLYHSNPDFTADEREVREIIEISFSEILKNENICESEVEAADRKKYNVPCFKLSNQIIWGATAMILNELRHIWIKYSDYNSLG